MATLKHIASKNSDYSAAETYLVYQHDEFSGKKILDEQSRPKLRESYILDTLECGEASFAMACLLANRKYDKNNHPDDIKSHQYIISFDPRDAAENGLTMEKAQALGLNFCKENFPGHPAIVCTHPDGHNHSGNIHVHIVIGSVRTREVERKPYMQKPRDWREGMKHSSTAQTMRHLRVAVMEMCQDAKLYQIDLLSSKKRVSEREYWMKRRSQMKLDRENAALLAAGQQPTQTEFETAKETLRKQISDVLDNAASFEDFSDRLLQQYGITVKKSRGRLSYLPAGRKKFIRAHSLGDKFEKELVLATLKENAKSQPIILHSNLEEKPDRIKKLVDIQAKLKQGKGIGYERWAKKHNLKAMAQTLILLQEKGLLNEDALDQRIAELDTKFHESLAVVKDLETRMANNQTLRRYGSSNNRDFSQDFFDCSLHKKNGSKCKGHFIRVKVLEGRVLSHVQRVTDYILRHEDYFRKVMEEQLRVESTEKLTVLKKQLARNEKRIADLKRLFMKIYEDNVNGKLSDDRFDMMSQSYDAEQKQLEEEVLSIQQEIEVQEQQIENIEKFVQKAHKYVHIEELTPYALRELVSAIYVDAPDKSSGKRVQHIHIKYDGLGYIPLDELEAKEKA